MPIFPAPEAVVLSSEASGWNGITVEEYRLPALNVPAVEMSQDVLTIHLSSPQAVQWVVEGRSLVRPLCSGDVCVLPQGLHEQSFWPQPFRALAVAFDPRFLSRLASEEGLSGVELRPQLGLSEPQVHHLGLALRAEMEGGFFGRPSVRRDGGDRPGPAPAGPSQRPPAAPSPPDRRAIPRRSALRCGLYPRPSGCRPLLAGDRRRGPFERLPFHAPLQAVYGTSPASISHRAPGRRGSALAPARRRFGGADRRPGRLRQPQPPESPLQTPAGRPSVGSPAPKRHKRARRKNKRGRRRISLSGIITA